MNRIFILILAVLLGSSLFAEYKIMSEDFEGSFLPSGWILQTTGLGFTQESSRSHGGKYSMGHGYNYVGDQDDWIISDLISIPSTVDSVRMSFWQSDDWATYGDTHEVCISTDMSNWDVLYSGLAMEDTWSQHSLDLDTYKGLDIYIGFHYVGNMADWWYVDDVEVNAYGGFIEIPTNLIPVTNSSVDWADYDQDGDLDIVLSGSTFDTSTKITRLYENTNGFTTFESFPSLLTGGSVEMMNLNNDESIDVIVTGDNGFTPLTRLYTSGANFEFTELDYTITGINGVKWSSTDVGDYDNDGDIDILITGSTSTINVSKIYRNDGNNAYTDINAGLPGVSSSVAQWGDYDNDGDLDILLTGLYYSRIYRNDAGVFTDINAGLQGVSNCSAAWGDYDNDGDLDIVLSGYTGSVYTSRIYRNDSGIFTNINASLKGVSDGSVAWGDYDNDGDLDLLLTGRDYNSSFHYFSKIYRNDSGIFNDSGIILKDLFNGEGIWGDYDNDGDLDVLLTGSDGTAAYTLLYVNNTETPNNPPAQPSNLAINNSDTDIIFSFDPSTDTETPAPALTYNIDLRVRGIYLQRADALSDGTRKVSHYGNIYQNTSWTLDASDYVRPQESAYTTFKVQAIDNGLTGSTIAEYSKSVRCDDLKLTNKEVMSASDELSWEAKFVPEIESYIIQIDEYSNFSSPFEETIEITENKLKGFNYNVVVSDLQLYSSLVDGKLYYWRIKPVYTGGTSTLYFSQTPNFFTLFKNNQLPSAPVSGFSPANDDLETTAPMISWGNAVDPDGNAQDLKYTIEIDSTNTFGSVLFTDTTDPGETFSQVSGLTDGYRYYYRIKTIDADLAESGWSSTQQFITLMPPQSVKITNDGTIITIDWDDMPMKTKGVIYTVYGSDDPYSDWEAVATQLTSSQWTTPISEAKKFYRVTAGSSSKKVNTILTILL